MSLRFFFISASLMAMICGSLSVVADEAVEAPPDPFDYSFCGGKPMYPVIGFNFSTACGPRNQIALGRRGRLMWLFPTIDGRVHARGERQLNTEELAKLKLLAQAAQLAGQATTTHGKVLYDMGINFSGQLNKRAHGTLDMDRVPDAAQALSMAMQRLVPEQPLLPECQNGLPDFSPTLLPQDRRLEARHEPGV